MHKYTCKNCDGELYWDSKVNALFCEYCESTYQPYEFEKEKNDEPSTMAQAESGATADDDSEGIDLVQYKCSECGAEIVTAAGTVATTCVYCGRALTLTKNLQGTFRPDFVIPFAVNKKDAKRIYKEYCKRSFLTPREFQSDENLKKIKGLYVPYWFHSFQNSASAEFKCENTTSTRRGDDKVITHHMYEVDIDATGGFDKLPTDALKNLDNSMMEAIEPFNYDNIQDFNPAYMAGFYAEKFNESAEELFPRAHNRASEAMQNSMRQNVGAYQEINLTSYRDNIYNYECHYAMLPVWIFNTEYLNKKYTFAINGSTGKITGKLPISIKKIFCLIFGSIVVTQLLALIVRLFG